VSRAELLERYQALPLPTTKDEHWRFTDLRGFDPESFSANGAKGVESAGSMLEIETSGVANVSEGGIQIERAPEGIVFEPLDEGHELLGTLVGTDEKFAAHNAAEWKHGLLVHVPAGVEVEQPLYVRVTGSVADAAQFWRLLIVAEEGARFSFIEEHTSASSEIGS
jgi:Fe-S cluster assembly protein SufD